jgi:hypothetical protein
MWLLVLSLISNLKYSGMPKCTSKLLQKLPVNNIMFHQRGVIEFHTMRNRMAENIVSQLCHM